MKKILYILIFSACAWMAQGQEVIITDGGGSGGTGYVTKLTDTVFLNPLSPQVAEVKEYVTANSIPTGTTLTYLPPIIDNGQRAVIRQNENYNAFPVLLNGSKGELFCYLRVGDAHVLNGDAVLFRSFDKGVTWDSVMVANYTGSSSLYGYGAGTIFERNDTLFATYQKSYYTGVTLDSISSYWKYSVNRGATWLGDTWISKPYATVFNVGESKAVVLPSGKVLFSVYGMVGATTTVKVGIIPENGSFANISYVNIPDGFGAENETCIVPNGDTLIAFIRHEGGASINRSISVNEGATWSTPTTITVFSDYRPVYPQAELLPDGRIIMASKDSITHQYPAYAVSEDKGLTWESFRLKDEVRYDGSAPTMYMDFELLSPTTIGAVYAIERVSGDREADLKFTTFQVPSAFAWKATSTGVEEVSGSSGEVYTPGFELTKAKAYADATFTNGTGTTNYMAKYQDANTLTNSLLFDTGTKVHLGETSNGFANKMSIRDVTTAATGTAAANNAIRVDQVVTPSANSTMNYSAVNANSEISGNFNTGGTNIGPNAVRGISSVLSGSGTHSQLSGGDFEGANYSASINAASKLYGLRGRAFSSAGTVAETFGVFGSGQAGNTALNSYSLYAGDARGVTNAFGLYIASQNVATNRYGLYQATTTNTNQFFGPVGLGGSKSDVDLTRFSISATYSPSSLTNAWGTLINISPGNITEATTGNNQTIAERSIIKLHPNVAYQSIGFTNYTITDAYGMLLHPPTASTNTTITRSWGLGVNGNVKIWDRMAIGTVTSPTAELHISAGTVAAQTAPIKLTSGPLMTTPEVGAIEFLTDRLYFTKTTGTIRETISYLSDLSNKLTKGGDTDGAAITAGTNDAFNFSIERNNVTRLALESGHTRLYTDAGNIAYQVNTSTQAQAFVVAPSDGNALAMSEQGGSSFFNYASNTETLTLGTNGSGSSVILNSLTAANWSTYTATATLSSLNSFDEVDVSASGQTFTFPTGATGGALKYVSNVDAVETITVAAPGGETVGGSTSILPGITAMFQKRGTVWRRLQ